MRNRSGLPFVLFFPLLCLLSLGLVSESYSQSVPASPPSATPADRALVADGVPMQDPAQAAASPGNGPAASAGDADADADAVKGREAAPAKVVQAESVEAAEAAGGASTKRVLIIGAVVLAVAALAILIGAGGGGSSGGGY